MDDADGPLIDELYRAFKGKVNWGADDFGKVTAVTFGGQTVNVNGDGGKVYFDAEGKAQAGEVGSAAVLEVKDSGEYTLTVTGAMNHSADGKVFQGGEPTPELTVRYSAGIARWIAERDGGPVEADGSAVRTMPLADREWAIRHVLQYGPDAQIVSPAELRDELRDRLQRMIDDR